MQPDRPPSKAAERAPKDRLFERVERESSCCSGECMCPERVIVDADSKNPVSRLVFLEGPFQHSQVPTRKSHPRLNVAAMLRPAQQDRRSFSVKHQAAICNCSNGTHGGFVMLTRFPPFTSNLDQLSVGPLLLLGPAVSEDLPGRLGKGGAIFQDERATACHKSQV